MPPPDQKRKPAPMAFGTGSEIENVGTSNDNLEHNPDSQFHQGKSSYASLPCPVAVAQQFGFLFAVYVRHQSGQIERRGLFESAKTASLAARELNLLFEQERTAG